MAQEVYAASNPSKQLVLAGDVGRKPNVVKFPVYDSPTGKVIEKLLKTGLKSPESCLLFQSLMAVNRQEYFSLEYDPTAITLADRYTLSGLVYGLAQGLDKSWLSAINGGSLNRMSLFSLMFLPSIPSSDGPTGQTFSNQTHIFCRKYTICIGKTFLRVRS